MSTRYSVLQSITRVLFISTSNFQAIERGEFSISFLVTSRATYASQPTYQEFFTPIQRFQRPVRSYIADEVKTLLQIQVIQVPFSDRLQGSSISFPFLPNLRSVAGATTSISIVYTGRFSPTSPFPRSSVRVANVSDQHYEVFIRTVPNHRTRTPDITSKLRVAANLSTRKHEGLGQLPSNAPVYVRQALLPNKEGDIGSFPS